MAIWRTKLAPVTKEQFQEKPLCLCKILAPVFFFLKLTGLFPIVSDHQEGRCIYRKSLLWISYTVGLIVFYIHQLSINYDFNMFSNRSFMQILRDVVNLVYAHCNLLLMFLSIIRIPKHIEVFEKISEVFRDGVFCQSARRIALKINVILIVYIFFMFSLQVGIFYVLSISTEIETNIHDYIFRLQFSQNISLFFHAAYVSMISVILGTLACFQKLMKTSLQYVPVHPMKGLPDEDNSRSLLGILKFKLCTMEHECPPRYSSFSRAEIVEYFRTFHQDISSAMACYNDYMNPAFLLHTVVVLIIIIIDYYAIVIHMFYEFTDPLERPNHFFNCLSCILHTTGFYWFLKNGQVIKNMMTASTNILLEYSTRVSDVDEHLQVRIFIEKLKLQSPLTASGVFDIDLSIAASISANILTYVLVALQFEIPKE